MPEQRRNSAMVGVLGGEFQRRYEAAFAWKSACSAFQALTGLRGFWPMSSFNEAGNAYDLSGQGRVLTYNGNPMYNYDGLAPYIDLDGTGDHLNRTDEAGLDIAIVGSDAFVTPRGLTLGGWFYSDVTGAASFLFSKLAAVGQFAYWIQQTGGIFSVGISGDGTAVVSVNAGAVTTAWRFLVGRFDPSNELAAFDNGTKTTNVAGIPANLFNSNADLVIGANSLGGILFNGRASLCFLCAAALSDAAVLSLFHQSRAAFGI